jgi:fumarate hydratase subunit beta
MNRHINLDTESDLLRHAECNEALLLSGTLYSARDAAHALIVQSIREGRPLSVNLKNRVIYYMGPTPARPGHQIGSCGPTSSYRMDAFMNDLMPLGIAATLGKGERDKSITELAVRYQCPYLITIGGASAYLAECVVSSKVVEFPHLGAEAVCEITVKDFPVIVAIDCRGQSIFENH